MFIEKVLMPFPVAIPLSNSHAMKYLFLFTHTINWLPCNSYFQDPDGISY
jgi:hypothetical protein